MPELYIIQNHPAVPPGVIGEYLQQRQIPFRLLRLDAGAELPELEAVAGAIVLGGYMGVNDEAEYPFLRPLKVFLRQAVPAGTPVLGICLGGQLLASVLGGDFTSGNRGEKGVVEIALSPAAAGDPLFAGLAGPLRFFEWHNDSFDLPSGADPLAQTAACPGQAFRLHNAWGLQFHPEVDRTIVADWSAKVDPEGRFVDQFAAVEEEHRGNAVKLLENFLKVVNGKL